MTTETTSIYIEIAKVQAKRRENWIPGFPIDSELEDAHQYHLAILRKQLLGTQEDKPKPSKAKPSFLTKVLATISRLFPRKLL